MKSILTAAVLVFFSNAASAATILEINNNNDFGISLNDGSTQVAGTFFTLTESYTNVSINAPITCVACNGTVVLHSGNVGPGASVADLVSGATFNTSLSNLFSGLSLGPGTYSLFASVTSGIGGWAGSLAPIQSGDGNGADGLDIVSATAEFYAPASIFSPTFSAAKLAYSISGDIVPTPPVNTIPLPASGVLLLVGLLGFRAVRRES